MLCERYRNSFRTAPMFKSRSLSKQTEVVQLLERSMCDKETVVSKETSASPEPYPLYGLYRYVQPQTVPKSRVFQPFGS